MANELTLAEHVDVLANVGDHTFLAVGNDELQKERKRAHHQILEIVSGCGVRLYSTHGTRVDPTSGRSIEA